jgi:homoisocitrate dehydrogenase
MTPKLCVIPGDGVGQEVVPAAVRVLRAVLSELEVTTAVAGWACFQQHGVAVPDETFQKIRQCGAGLFGAVSSPSYKVDGYQSAIVTLRKRLNLYANVRPVRSWPLADARPGVDLIIVRENTEGLYSGQERLSDDGHTAVTERIITRTASERLARRAYDLARAQGRRKVTIVHKANVMPVGDGLFRQTVHEVAAEYPEIETDELLADMAAFWLLRDPSRFDVVVTTNMFGDILSDTAAHWGGGMGLVPSLNWGTNTAVAEPVHGSAPDIAGQGIANPLATILSAALLVRTIWQQPELATQIENAVEKTLAAGILTRDLGGVASTAVMTDAIIERLSIPQKRKVRRLPQVD